MDGRTWKREEDLRRRDALRTSCAGLLPTRFMVGVTRRGSVEARWGWGWGRGLCDVVERRSRVASRGREWEV